MAEMTVPVVSAAPQVVPCANEPPLAILQGVADDLTQRTGGLLVGRVHTTHNDDATMIWFHIAVPAMHNFRRTILVAIHPNDRDYPTWIYAECFPGSRSIPPYAILTPEQEKEEFVAANAEQLRHLVGIVFQAPVVSEDMKYLAAQAREILSQNKP